MHLAFLDVSSANLTLPDYGRFARHSPKTAFAQENAQAQVKTTEVKAGSPHAWSWVCRLGKEVAQLHANWDGLFK